MANDQFVRDSSAVEDEKHVEETMLGDESEMYEETSLDVSEEIVGNEDVTEESGEAEITDINEEDSNLEEGHDDEASINAGDPDPEEEDSAEAGDEDDDEEGDDDEDDEDDEDEEDPEDPADAMRDSCSKSATCRPLMSKFESCEERVTSKSHTEETCLEEYLDFIKCRDKCVSRDLHSKLK